MTGDCSRVWGAVFVGLVCLLGVLPAHSENIHVSQFSLGAGDGSSPTDTRSMMWLDEDFNWGTAPGQVGPGDTVVFHGALTSTVTIHGSGADGARLVLDFDDASMDSITSWQTLITANDQSHFTIRNLDYSGTESTTVTCISLDGTPNVIIEDCEFEKIGVGILNIRRTTDGLTIRNNRIIGAHLKGVDLQQDLIVLGDARNVLIEDNYLELRKQSGGPNHCDAIQCFESGGQNTGLPTNWTIRRNIIINDAGEIVNQAQYAHSWLQLEHIEGLWQIYNNLFIGLDVPQGGNGISLYGNVGGNVVGKIFNNTIYKKTGPGTMYSLQNFGAYEVRNNILYLEPGAPQGFLSTNGTVTRSNNLYFGSSDFQEIADAEPDSLYVTSAVFANRLASDFHLFPGSPAVDAGIALPEVTVDLEGAGRPQGAAYDIGAYETILEVDTDGDGVIDILEDQAGTDPTDPLDFPDIPLALWPFASALLAAGIYSLRSRRPL